MLKAFILTAADADSSETSHSILIPELPDLIWGTIAFLVVLAVVWFLVLPRFNKMLDERRDAIEGSMERAAAAQSEAASAKREAQLALESVRANAAEAREAAKKDADAYRAELRAAAVAEADQIKATAQVQIEAERVAAQAQLKNEVGSLALDIASGVLGEQLTGDQAATAYVDRFLADLETSAK